MCGRSDSPAVRRQILSFKLPVAPHAWGGSRDLSECTLKIYDNERAELPGWKASVTMYLPKLLTDISKAAQ